jgi:hypothetical protein
MSRLILFIALAFEAALACSGSSYMLRGEEIQPGVFQVSRASGYFPPPGPQSYEPIGTVTMAEFKHHFDTVLANNALVFIATIDSVVEAGFPPNPTPIELPDPDFVLSSIWMHSSGEFYLRLSIDTLIKGTLPSKLVWLKGYRNGTSCGTFFTGYKGLRFLNYSDHLDTMPDLKLSEWESFCANCPRANTFDGRYLRSPEFPVLSIDIREVLPGFPVSLNSSMRTPIKVPLRSPGKAYLPDGRTAPSDDQVQRKAPVPLLR